MLSEWVHGPFLHVYRFSFLCLWAEGARSLGAFPPEVSLSYSTRKAKKHHEGVPRTFQLLKMIRFSALHRFCVTSVTSGHAVNLIKSISNYQTCPEQRCTSYHKSSCSSAVTKLFMTQMTSLWNEGEDVSLSFYLLPRHLSSGRRC